MTQPYYQDSDCTIYHADCRELSEISVAAVVTSPPYNSGVAYDEHTDSMDDEAYAELAASVSMLMYDWLRETNGRALVNTGSRFHTWLTAMEANGLYERHVIAWDYGLPTSGTAWGSWQSPAGPNLRYAWEPIICAYAGEWQRTPPTGMERWRTTQGDWAWLCRNLWEIPPGGTTAEARGMGHPAVMPIKVADNCVRISTWPGETVLDPFMGSGTTLLAARARGRKSIGCDVSENYCELAAKRLAQGHLFTVETLEREEATA